MVAGQIGKTTNTGRVKRSGIGRAYAVDPLKIVAAVGGQGGLAVLPGGIVGNTISLHVLNLQTQNWLRQIHHRSQNGAN
jgi:hypothetical protein